WQAWASSRLRRQVIAAFRSLHLPPGDPGSPSPGRTSQKPEPVAGGEAAVHRPQHTALSGTFKEIHIFRRRQENRHGRRAPPLVVKEAQLFQGVAISPQWFQEGIQGPQHGKFPRCRACKIEAAPLDTRIRPSTNPRKFPRGDGGRRDWATALKFRQAGNLSLSRTDVPSGFLEAAGHLSGGTGSGAGNRDAYATRHRLPSLASAGLFSRHCRHGDQSLFTRRSFLSAGGCRYGAKRIAASSTPSRRNSWAKEERIASSNRLRSVPLRSSKATAIRSGPSCTT